MNTLKVKKTELSILLAFVFVLILGNMNTFSAQCSTIRENTLRLHIRAHSDNEDDQALKLKVRDTVTVECADLFREIEDQQEAKEVTQDHIKEIEQVAKKAVETNGYQYHVKAKLTNMYFETRVYEGFTLPAGYYDAITIDIGDGLGKNWWCVLFPPLCVAPTLEKPQPTEQEIQNEQDKLLDKSLEEEQKEIVKGQDKYEVKFALVELWESWKK